MRFLILFYLLSLASVRSEDFQGASHQVQYEAAPISYNEAVPTNAVSRLRDRIQSGQTSLEYDKQFGYLPALLKELQIPAASQMLVFSKTSLQRSFISPENPRAIFFNDDVYIGYIPGAPALEVSTADPKLGAAFYRLENTQTDRPAFSRTLDCLNCHGAERTLGVPGHFVRSVETDSNGELKAQTEVRGIDQCTPLSDRWAGWFVTGESGTQAHKGNIVDGGPRDLGNLQELSRFFDTKKHLRPTSDITALLILEHQIKMHNYITRLNFETQIMMGMYGHIRYLKSQVDAFLRYMLFTEEAPLTAAIAGDPEFARAFTSQGPFDHQHRSLRDLDLKTRLFKYPCSYLIYSEQFDALPAVMREHLLERLHLILTEKDKSPPFARLTSATRKAILEILRDTKPNLPPCWKE